MGAVKTGTGVDATALTEDDKQLMHINRLVC